LICSYGAIYTSRLLLRRHLRLSSAPAAPSTPLICPCGAIYASSMRGSAWEQLAARTDTSRRWDDGWALSPERSSAEEDDSQDDTDSERPHDATREMEEEEDEREPTIEDAESEEELKDKNQVQLESRCAPKAVAHKMGKSTVGNAVKDPTDSRSPSHGTKSQNKKRKRSKGAPLAAEVPPQPAAADIVALKEREALVFEASQVATTSLKMKKRKPNKRNKFRNNIP
ncbi:hypothetical protein CYMTET_40862, partial [Cymbomonas tetramitiformis]